MNQTYYTIITKQGAALLANATALGIPLKITQMAVGDGNGKIPKPNASQTQLVHEVRRAAVNTLFVDQENPNQIIAEQVIPETDGGWFIHEIGLFDDKGNLIAVGNCPATYKPKLVEGSGRTQVIRMVIIVDNTQSVELKINPAVVLATRQYVDGLITAKMTAHEKTTNHPNATTKSKGFVQLNSAIDSSLENQAATPLAVKKTYDMAIEAIKKANDLMSDHEKSTNHPNATTKSKGFVQLNSETNSLSETEAATPFAVKKAYDEANNAKNIAMTAVKRSGDNMTGELRIKGNRALVDGDAFPFCNHIGDKNLNDIRGLQHGVYFQARNEGATIQNNYPLPAAGLLIVGQTGGEGVNGCIQTYTDYYSGRQFIRTYREIPNIWSNWIEQITTENIANYFPAKSWQNLTSQRALNVTYTNTGKWPIFLAVGLTHGWSGTVATMTLTINGVNFVSSAGGAGNGSTKTVAMYMPIPAGNSFSVTGNAPLFFWYELR